MNKTIKTAIDNISSVVNVMTDNITSYTNKALTEVKTMNPEVELEIKPVLGYETGDQGWYDQTGGGPCNKYCRYTGLAPNIKWTCSNENDLSKLVPTPKDKTGNFCYGYDKKTKSPAKTGVVVRGQFISTVKPESNVQDSGNYNFVIYNNKKAQNIDNFDNTEITTTPNSNQIENFEANDTKCVFSPTNYSDYYSDLKNAFGNNSDELKTHYLTYGINEGRTPCGTINTECKWNANDYLTANQDVKNAGVDPLNHYKTYGINEGRSPCPVVTPENTNWVPLNPGVDYPYNDIPGGSFQINQVSDCGNACNNNSQCVGFVTNSSGNYCWLKSALQNDNSNWDRNGYTINKNSTSTDPRWEGPQLGTDFSGPNLSDLAYVNSPSDCGELCVKNPQCKGFSVTNNGKICWLTQNISQTYQNQYLNAYKLKERYDVVNNVSLKECENICQNDSTCKGFNYDSAKKSCAVSQETINPTQMDTNSVSGNKKVHKPLNGTFNLYQNNSCVNSTLFNPDANVTASLGIATNDNGIPILPKKPVCPSKLNNNFIFGNNYEIMALDTDIKETVVQGSDCSFWGGCDSWDYTTDQQVNDARCLQANSDGTVTKANCTYTDNQKWTYDDSINSIRTWDGGCLNVDTAGQNIKVGIKPCSDDVNQKFYLKPVAENLQPTNFTVLDGFDNISNNKTTNSNNIENFATNTDVNNYLSSNRNSQDYLYKLPYSSPYVKKLNNIENFESCKGVTINSFYFIYLIVIILLLVFVMNK